ncbi:hypothetical protein BpHYR1_001519 [Brachionus plicatilis]|uniref:Uncharacterized protein n=1 Tax=Brachionus plicatilis TaxID=10195 RepID=A0A3M7P8Z3_BRAPC|nr:hypothetical protein BpHYR1_001519 [Brachionus plicatilis]
MLKKKEELRGMAEELNQLSVSQTYGINKNSQTGNHVELTTLTEPINLKLDGSGYDEFLIQSFLRITRPHITRNFL